MPAGNIEDIKFRLQVLCSVDANYREVANNIIDAYCKEEQTGKRLKLDENEAKSFFISLAIYALGTNSKSSDIILSAWRLLDGYNRPFESQIQRQTLFLLNKEKYQISKSKKKPFPELDDKKKKQQTDYLGRQEKSICEKISDRFIAITADDRLAFIQKASHAYLRDVGDSNTDRVIYPPPAYLLAFQKKHVAETLEPDKTGDLKSEPIAPDAPEDGELINLTENPHGLEKREPEVPPASLNPPHAEKHTNRPSRRRKRGRRKPLSTREKQRNLIRNSIIGVSLMLFFVAIGAWAIGRNAKEQTIDVVDFNSVRVPVNVPVDHVEIMQRDLAELEYSEQRTKELIPIATEGNAEAQYELACLYCKSKEYDKAERWLLSAAQQDYTKAQTKLSVLYLTYEKYSDSFYWADRAEWLGDPLGEFLVGYYYHYGYGVDKVNYDLAKEKYEDSLNKGAIYAANNLGLLYAEGMGDESNYTKALRYFNQAYENGIIEAAHNIGCLYQYGTWPKKDIYEAIVWYTACAEQRHYAISAVALGQIYYFGIDIAPNYSEAKKWLTLAAEEDNADGQLLLGNLYMHENGMRANNYKLGIYWLTRSANHDNYIAEIYLGQCYAEGYGVKPNFEEAIKWYSLAEKHEEVAEVARFLIDDLNEYSQHHVI